MYIDYAFGNIRTWPFVYNYLAIVYNFVGTFILRNIVGKFISSCLQQKRLQMHESLQGIFFG